MSEVKEATETMVEAVPEVKPARKSRAKKAAVEGTAAEVKKTRTKKAAEKPAETAPAEKKTRTRKAAAKPAAEAEAVPAEKAPEVTVTVQFGGLEYKVADVVAAVKAAVEEETAAIEIYLKPEEGVAYYAVNGVGGEDKKIDL